MPSEVSTGRPADGPTGGPIGGGFVPWSGDVPGPLAPALDAGVRDLVLALNRTAFVRTVFSCAGHPEETDSVARGRRQAHVDVAVRDLGRWRRYAERCRRHAPEAVRRLGLPGGARLRCVEGGLGPVPPWLEPALEGAATWHYRRLVFEPVPYTQPAADCRRALDAALAAAVDALATEEGCPG